MESMLVRFKNKNYYVKYDDLLNKAAKKLWAYEDPELTKIATINGLHLIFNKDDLEGKLRTGKNDFSDIKMNSPMPGAAKTENNMLGLGLSTDQLEKMKIGDKEKFDQEIDTIIRSNMGTLVKDIPAEKIVYAIEFLKKKTSMGATQFLYNINIKKLEQALKHKKESKIFKENKMTKEEKLRKYIREMIREAIKESDPYGKPDEDKYLFKTGQDYLAGIQGDSGMDEAAEQPSAEDLAAKEAAAKEAQKKAAYQRFFSQALAKFGYSSPASIPDEKKKSFYDYIDANWTSKQEAPIEETSATGGVAGYETPAAFTGKKGISKKQKSIANQLGYELVDKSYAVKDQGDVQDLNEKVSDSQKVFYKKIMDTLQSYNENNCISNTYYDEVAFDIVKLLSDSGLIETKLNEGLDSYYFKDENLTAEQKLGLAMRQVRNNLYEVEKVVQRTIKMKKEENVDSTKVGKRTYSALRRINEKVVRLMVALQDLK